MPACIRTKLKGSWNAVARVIDEVTDMVSI